MGLAAASSCLVGDLDTAEAEDARPAENPCFDGTFGVGREALGSLSCTSP